MAGGIVVFAYSEVGYACLDVLLAQGRRVLALFTHEDGPGEEIWFRSCAALARRHGVPVYTIEASGPGDEVEGLVRALAPDLILSAYYRRMIPMRILSLARLGAFNMHGSLLPKYRGRAPLNWAILNGETRVGVTLHVMTGRADAGDIVDQEAVAVAPDETAGEVAPRLAQAAAKLLARRTDDLLAGTAPRTPQNEAGGQQVRRPHAGRRANRLDLARAPDRQSGARRRRAFSRRFYISRWAQINFVASQSRYRQWSAGGDYFHFAASHCCRRRRGGSAGDDAGRWHSRGHSRRKCPRLAGGWKKNGEWGEG
ncbi:MAG: formyltransferase family protein [Parvibaculaceae bacterium]|nr:formyltransferase family protein [Parvibaculaceae bacterium]